MRSPILLEDYPYYQKRAHQSLLSRKSSRIWARASLICDVRSVFIAPAVLGPLGNIGVRYCVFKNAFFFIIWILLGVAIACGSEEPTPTPVPVPELLPARAMYDGYRMVSSYQETVKGGEARFEGMPLFNVTGPDENIYLHIAANTGADIVCVFPASQKITLDELLTAQPKVFVGIEGIVHGWEGDDTIIDSCTTIP